MTSAPSSQEGFTLLEMLVSVTLMGLLAILLFGSLHFASRAWERSEANGDEMGDLRLVQELLRREIEQAYPAAAVTGAEGRKVEFLGTADTMRFLGPAPLAGGLAGNAWIVLNSGSSGGDRQLTIRASPELAVPGTVPWKDALLRGASTIHFSYFDAGADDGAPGWRDHWIGQKTLPAMVRIQIAFPKRDARAWPELVVAPRIAADADCIYEASTHRCRE